MRGIVANQEERPTTFAGLCRVHRRRGPEMFVRCPSCHQEKWVEYGQLRCSRCRVERSRATRRGGVLLIVSGFAAYGSLMAVDWPLAISVPATILSVAAMIVGVRRVL